jgi:hypothetical protein
MSRARDEVIKSREINKHVTRIIMTEIIFKIFRSGNADTNTEKHFDLKTNNLGFCEILIGRN